MQVSDASNDEVYGDVTHQDTCPNDPDVCEGECSDL